MKEIVIRKTGLVLILTASSLAVAVLFLGALGSVNAQPPGIPKGDVIIELETVASGLTSPVLVANASDGSGRLFIVDQAGQIRIVENNGNLLPTPFLDITSVMITPDAGFDERGLLGLAFHPDYANNGRFFVRYSGPRDGVDGEPCFGSSRGCHEEILSEYSVSNNDPNVAEPNGAILFSVDEPQFNHDGGDVAFGPDGFLYFGLGDGGGAHDGLADTPPSHGPGHGQDINTPLGAILRIDVDSQPQASLAYAIPVDNPFVGQPGLDEMYAYGLRNPYRFSFDDGPGGDGSLYLADAGQNLFEEINIIERGGNYGWVAREGLHCFDPFNPTNPPANCPNSGPLGEPLIDPIAEYSHPGFGFNPEGGIAIIGGFVYRGSSPNLRSKYIFGDFSKSFVPGDGSIYYLQTNPNFEIRQFQIGVGDVPYGLYLLGFGEGENGEVYVAGSLNLGTTGDTGIVQRIVGGVPVGDTTSSLNTGGSGRSVAVIAMLVGGIAGFFTILVASGWYTWRRWLGSRF